MTKLMKKLMATAATAAQTSLLLPAAIQAQLGPDTSTSANLVDGKFMDAPDLFGSPYLAAPTLFGETSYTGFTGEQACAW
jgi:hypothetical protein